MTGATASTPVSGRPGPHRFGYAGQRWGEVVAFDKDAGLGTVRETAGREYTFHCTEVADGSRRAEVGSQVAFRVGPGRLGRWEGRQVSVLPGSGSGSVP
ncbi:MAG TPA: hypothetical protein VFN61_11140, partial [Acidimicrobiales bacterium]|nr:hypothetical protein [Acidimicrobiales bacterium]